MADVKSAPAKAPVVSVIDRQPMEMQFEIPEELRKKYPDRHFRFVNTSRRELGDLRTKLQGYTPVEGADAITIGELRLMSCPKALQEQRQARNAKLTREREGRFRDEAKEGIAKLGLKPTED